MNKVYPKYYWLKTFLRVIAKWLPSNLRRSRFGSYWERIHVWEFAEHQDFFSQNGQDIFVSSLFEGGVKNGVFVDIGAHDGISFSNTYFFESVLGWSGVCIEATPETFEMLRSNRRCDCIEGAAATRDGKILFSVLPGEANMGNHVVVPCDVENDVVGEVIEVRGVDILSALEERSIKKVNYLSIDTEGGEVELFKHMHNGGISIDVVSMEQNEDCLEMDREMRNLGFAYIAKVGPDRIYRLRSIS